MILYQEMCKVNIQFLLVTLPDMGLPLRMRKNNYWHVVIDFEGIKKDKVIEEYSQHNAEPETSRLSTISIARTFENVNSKDLL